MTFYFIKMDSSFWTQLDSWKKNKKLDQKEEFESNYLQIHKMVYAKMITAGDIFCQYVGADDGHDDLVNFIIWNGRNTVEKFLENASSALLLSSTMMRDPGFNGDVNSLRQLIMN